MIRPLGRLLAGAAAFVAAVALAAAGDPVAVPKLTAHVIDQTGTLTAAERDALDGKLASFEAAKGSQVVVLIVPTVGSEVIEEFAGRVADTWQLGRKGVDDGVLFVIAKQERKLRIQTGRGVQGTLTDAASKRIVSDIVAPRFRTGDFAGGIDAGVDAIMKSIEGEALPAPAQRKVQPRVDTLSSYGNALMLAFFLVPILGMVLRGLFGRFFGAAATSGLTGVAGMLVFGSLGVAIVVALAAFVVTLASGTGLARAAHRGRGGGWGGGFGGGGWSSGGGGFGGGGFSGGGGSFDGGGASGGW